MIKYSYTLTVTWKIECPIVTYFHFWRHRLCWVICMIVGRGLVSQSEWLGAFFASSSVILMWCKAFTVHEWRHLRLAKASEKTARVKVCGTRDMWVCFCEWYDYTGRSHKTVCRPTAHRVAWIHTHLGASANWGDPSQVWPERHKVSLAKGNQRRHASGCTAFYALFDICQKASWYLITFYNYYTH